MNKKLNADFDLKNRGFFNFKKWLDHLWKKVVINWKERISNEKERLSNEKRDIERKGDKNNGEKQISNKK